MTTLPTNDSMSYRTARGCVKLVGAGPGDPELLTLKAVNAIRQATLLLVDDLVNRDVLQHAAPRARIVEVGKRGGCVSTSQSFIEKLMVLAARDGEQVVRLKGGDPFIFGRGGEEVAHLRAAGIHVEVINGITAGLAGATSISVPLTHREHAHGVVFVTGHNRPGDEATDWAALATAARTCHLTLVIYMGLSSIASIRTGLLENLPADTPVAVIRNATLPDQQSVTCMLATLENTIVEHGLQSPAVMVIGDVVAAAHALHAQASIPTAIAA